MLIARVATILIGAPIVVLLVWIGGLPLLIVAAIAASLTGREAIVLIARSRTLQVASSAQTSEVSSSAESQSQLAAEPVGESVERPFVSNWGTFVVASSAILVLAAAGGPLGEVAALGLILLACLTAFLWLPNVGRLNAGWSDAFAAAVYGGFPLALLILARQWPGETGVDVAVVGRLERGAAWVFVALTTVWAVDSAAYVVGRLVGRRRLWPRISPGKTWEGTGAGVIAGVAVCEIWAPVVQIDGGLALLLGLALGGSAVLGDLAESAMKRAARVKDSGTLLPGHGGLLDRIDSLAFASIVVFLSGLLTTSAGLRRLF